MGEKREERILCYTRTPMEDAVYSAKLADSMHLALVDKEGVCTPLNHNSGILYAKAVQNQDGTLQAKSLKNPWLFRMSDGSFGVIARRIEADGSPDESAKGKLLFFTSEDLLRYQEHGLLDLGRGAQIVEAVCHYEGDGIIWSGWKKMKNVSMPSLKSSLRADSRRARFCPRQKESAKRPRRGWRICRRERLLET